jgi:hypothetical protein
VASSTILFRGKKVSVSRPRKYINFGLLEKKDPLRTRVPKREFLKRRSEGQTVPKEHAKIRPPMDDAFHVWWRPSTNNVAGNLVTRWNLDFLRSFGSKIRYMIKCAMIKAVHVEWPFTQ